jgi:hypothetical protein
VNPAADEWHGTQLVAGLQVRFVSIFTSFFTARVIAAYVGGRTMAVFIGKPSLRRIDNIG